MNRSRLKLSHALALGIAGLLSISPAAADKPRQFDDSRGKSTQAAERNEKGDKKSSNPSGRDSGRSGNVKSGEYFADQHRVAVRDYYTEQFSRGACPPGLAKKRNGCMPPGQAKKWSIGRPLPREVIFYDLPGPLLGRLDRSPAGYRYVRVAADILLIAIGTGMVIDAIEDLGRM